MLPSHFFANLARMKLIYRWPLMRNIQPENIAEHSLQVAMVAHALGIIKNRLFGGSVNADRAAVMALYHDSSEVLTGDLPTPVKYFNPEIAREYKKIELAAEQRLLGMLPPELVEDFARCSTRLCRMRSWPDWSRMPTPSAPIPSVWRRSTRATGSSNRLANALRPCWQRG